MTISTTSIVRLCGAALGIALASVPLLAGQPAPVPAQILTAKKVFISNAGVDGASLAVFMRGGDVNEPYNRFYAAMKSWGRFDIVGAPSDAELVLEIRFTAQLANCGSGYPPTREPQFELTILDARSHFPLWVLAEPVGSAVLKANWEKNFDQGLTNLVDRVKSLAGAANR
jgi:hypothetical protein